MSDMRVTIWNEFIHERENAEVARIYPRGIHHALAEALAGRGVQNIHTATLDEPEQGLPESILAQTDVLLWWGHAAHDAVQDDLVTRIQQRVWAGMGLIILHSAHWSKPFKRMTGTNCGLCWREAGERERVWVAKPGHPIAAGIDDYVELDHAEMYGEPFDIPNPDEVVFMSWFEGGEVFRSGCAWTRGSGRMFYFSPGHETYPIYHHPQIQRIIFNAVQWARPQGRPASVPRHVPVAEAREKLTAQGPSVHDAGGRIVAAKS